MYKYIFQRPELSSEDLLCVCGPKCIDYVVTNTQTNAVISAMAVTRKFISGHEQEVVGTKGGDDNAKTSFLSPNTDIGQ